MLVTPAIDFINTVGGLLIALAYLTMMKAGRKDGAIGVPFAVAILYVAWDLNWLVENLRFVFRGGPVHAFMLTYLAWPFLSIPLLAMVAREQASLSWHGRDHRVSVTAVAVLAAGAAMAATGAELGFYRGLIQVGYVVAMIVSGLFWFDLARSPDLRGKRLSIVAYRAVGVQLFVAGDLVAQVSPLPMISGAVCLLFDALYAAVLVMRRREEAASSNCEIAECQLR